MAVKAKSGKAKAKSGKAKSKPIGRYSHRTAWLNKVLFQEGFWTMEEKQFSISIIYDVIVSTEQLET